MGSEQKRRAWRNYLNVLSSKVLSNSRFNKPNVCNVMPFFSCAFSGESFSAFSVGCAKGELGDAYVGGRLVDGGWNWWLFPCKCDGDVVYWTAHYDGQRNGRWPSDDLRCRNQTVQLRPSHRVLTSQSIHRSVPHCPHRPTTSSYSHSRSILGVLVSLCHSPHCR